MPFSLHLRIQRYTSGPFSLLPAEPKIFHGRDSELQHVVTSLLSGPARVTILGPGGMRKTTLALAAQNHTIGVAKYPTRHLIACHSANTVDSLIAIVASNLGLNSSTGSTKHIISHLNAGEPCLIIVDNFDTLGASGQLILTCEGLRGLEKFDGPFLPPLLPLTSEAALQTFIEIADDVHNTPDVKTLLEITDNIPLAIQLIAAAAASEGCQETFQRWEAERTSLLSIGFDKRANFEMSIKLSLSSPRMQSSPDAARLLSLISLSDGISDIDLIRILAPIREFVQINNLKLRTGDSVGASIEHIRLFVRSRSTDNELACACLKKLADPSNHVPPNPTESITSRQSARNILTVHQALLCLGKVLGEYHADEGALSISLVALEGFTWMGVHQSTAECMQTLGDIYLRRGDHSKASNLWNQARPLYERSSQARAVQGIDCKLTRIEEHHQANLEKHTRIISPTEPMQQFD
ncbi:hypothetical protein C8R45DRAFT_935171 [Mycena sanguinolenta]|nr:hypothetical protein C8R45DRAFT_935171 [Mycena sanguinolenta]